MQNIWIIDLWQCIFLLISPWFSCHNFSCFVNFGFGLRPSYPFVQCHNFFTFARIPKESFISSYSQYILWESWKMCQFLDILQIRLYPSLISSYLYKQYFDNFLDPLFFFQMYSLTYFPDTSTTSVNLSNKINNFSPFPTYIYSTSRNIILIQQF